MIPLFVVKARLVDMGNNHVTLAGYRTVEQIYVGTRTLVYRAIRESDSYPVVIKLLRSEYPNFNELVQFRNQYTIAKNLDLPGIVRPLCLETYRNGYALIMEDFGGISLKEYVALLAAEGQELSKKLPITHDQLPISEFLSIAIQIVSTLDCLIRRRVIHKDIKPANILINPTTKEVKLIDFSIASLLPRETQTLTSPNVLEGTLAYLSPEQTGRMNRGIDYRSDFYSLGVTFFELLTGQLPFSSEDPMELVHCHIAKLPPSVHNVNPDIPLVLSEIVKKLMAKNAEDRYQSALGLKHDLLSCLYQLKETGKIEGFELGSRDISDRFIIPEKLYGRETEIATLLAAFERVAASGSQAQPGNEATEAEPLRESEAEPLGMRSQVEPGNEGDEGEGKAEMMLVAGFSGIGKTAVVNEIHKPIIRQRGYFIKGKFDQFQRNIPFSAFVQAFRDLMGQLLTESNDQIKQWQTKIILALGDQGQVIIEVIPELERIIGKQPPVQELSGTAAQNRFNLLFQKFIQVFTTKEHPLVIFLDDLQWADSASLKLMQLLMSETDTRYLLLIGAYRDNEVQAAHPLILTLGEIHSSGATINSITLEPLKQTDLNLLIADTLSCSEQLAAPLTELVYHKTQGNPFFATQFIKSLKEDGLIYFNFDVGYWECDLAIIRALSLTDDVVEFMALQLQKLPEATQEVLKLAACIGNKFDLSTLAIVYEKSQIETAADLWKALQEGLILPQSDIYKFFQADGDDRKAANQLPITNYQSPNYQFLHDRVQQAAYFLIPCDRKQLTHFKIGQLLLQNTPETEREQNIFEIVNQLNYGLDLITQKDEREQLAQLNLLAGKKAKASTAYAAANEYLNTGIKLLKVDAWQSQYELTLALHEEAAEAAYLSGNFESMNQLVDIVDKSANSLIEKLKLYEVKLQSLMSQNQRQEALSLGQSLLLGLGVNTPENPTENDIQLALADVARSLQEISIEDLAVLPLMTAPEQLAIMRILSAVWATAYLSCPLLMPIVTCQQVLTSIKNGNAPQSAFAYVNYGLILYGLVGDIEAGFQFAQLGLSLLSQHKANSLNAKTMMIGNVCVIHSKMHIRSTIQPLQEAYTSGLETGDFEYGGYSALYYCAYSYLAGKELTALEKEMTSYRDTLRQRKIEIAVNYLELYRQPVLNLLGHSQKPYVLNFENCSEETQLEMYINTNNLLGASYLYINKIVLCYLFSEYQLAFLCALLAENYLPGVIGTIVVPIYYFYKSLIQLALYSGTSTEDRDRIITEVVYSQEKLQKWAHHAPMNHLHKYYLVEAERHRVLGEKIEAIEMYDRAIKIARINEYTNEEALSNELAAKFYLEWGKEKIAQTYLIEAYYCYARWGAKAKVEDLEKRYPQLLAPILLREKINANSSTANSITSETFTSTSAGGSALLDLTTVMKAAQTLSKEIVLEQLLSNLMQVLIENAGAENGCLILPKDGNLVIEATQISRSTQANVLQSIPIESSSVVPVTVINYVWRTQKSLVTNDVTAINRFASDPYIIQRQPKSLLCSPIVNRGKLIGIIYLENNLIAGAFTSDRIKILNLLCTQAAISLENARLYQKSQEYAQQLEKSLQQLQQTQLQMIQSEKMSALGNLVAGVAHEINNPVGFISGNINEARETVEDLINHLRLYQEKFPNPGDEIEQDALDIDLEYALSDLPKMLESMKVGCDRIRNISTSLRTFSRADSTSKVSANLHEGLDTTLMILQYRLKAKENRPAIALVKEYGNIPPIPCYFGQLNQVFMNIISNAIDALEESNQGRNYATIEAHPNIISIKTEIAEDKQSIVIKIKDNALGMTQAVKSRIFDHLFTTKAVGKGTGLGLSISRQIVEENHGGSLTCSSVLGEGTEFAIALPLDRS